MRYLFFDCEFANCYNGKEKICEFGYVMVDETFNVLYKGNIINNPNIKEYEWDWYALRSFTRKRVYEKDAFLPQLFKKNELLIKNSDVY